MRIFWKILRFTIAVIAIFSVIFSIGEILTPTPDAEILRQTTGFTGTQEFLDSRWNKHRFARFAVAVFWGLVAWAAISLEIKSNKK